MTNREKMTANRYLDVLKNLIAHMKESKENCKNSEHELVKQLADLAFNFMQGNSEFLSLMHFSGLPLNIKFEF